MTTDRLESSSDQKKRFSVEILLVALAVALALGLRVWALWLRGVVDFDETYYYILGRNLITGKGYRLNGLPHTAFPPLYPVLVGLASLILPGIRLATSAVSAAAGALLVVPVYLLARDIHGRRAARFAAFATAVWPALFFFAASGVGYAMRMYFGSEPLYVTLAATGFLFVWLVARRGGMVKAALAGVACGLAALTRSEGPIVFSFAYLWLIIAQTVRRDGRAVRRLVETALVAAVMLATLFPFALHVRLASGRWGLGAKLANNVRIRETLWRWVVENKSDEFAKTHYAISSDGKWMEDPYWGVSEYHRAQLAAAGPLSSGLALVAKPDWRWAGVFSGVFWKGPAPLVPRPVWVFGLILLGLCMRPWGKPRALWWGLVAAAFAAMFLLAISLYVLPRHELPLLALIAVALGKGLDAAARIVERAAQWLGQDFTRVGKVAAFVPAALLLWSFARKGVELNVAGNRLPGPDVSAQSQRADRLACEQLTILFPAYSPVLSHYPWLAAWAGMDWRVTPDVGGARLAEYAKARGIRYAVLRPWQKAMTVDLDSLKPYSIGELKVDGWYFLYDFQRGED